MSEISDFESRIAAALDRIRYSAERLTRPVQTEHAEPADHWPQDPQDADPVAAPVAAGPDPRVAELEKKLEEERLANAQLEERVQALKARQDGRVAELEAAAEGNLAKLARFEKDINRLREVNAELRANNGRLREALEDGITEPELINRAMAAELEALRALRQADATEVDAVLDELRPLIEGAS
ncbi:hypothetical protein [Marivivens marinus]|uniref:hypothetical protein n=1 Tax=Marivivens marinus TaxID=3110173 RepID=UPI003B846B10